MPRPCAGGSAATPPGQRPAGGYLQLRGRQQHALPPGQTLSQVLPSPDSGLPCCCLAALYLMACGPCHEMGCCRHCLQHMLAVVRGWKGGAGGAEIKG